MPANSNWHGWNRMTGSNVLRLGGLGPLNTRKYELYSALASGRDKSTYSFDLNLTSLVRQQVLHPSIWLLFQRIKTKKDCVALYLCYVGLNRAVVASYTLRKS